jgi:hypothetical protein
MSLIFAAQLTAVATAVLAVFAFITAILAGLAFRKQSREVGTIERGVEVHVKNTSDQPIYNVVIDWTHETSPWQGADHRRVLMPGDQQDSVRMFPDDDTGLHRELDRFVLDPVAPVGTSLGSTSPGAK